MHTVDIHSHVIPEAILGAAGPHGPEMTMSESGSYTIRDSKAKKPVAEYLPHLYFDCLLHDVRARRLLLEVAGIDHVMMGSNYAGLHSVDGIALVDELGLPEQARALLIGGNAKRLFKLDLR